MAKCNFCDRPVKPGTGMIYVKTDGKVLNFCSKKCEKNRIVLKRKAKNLKWTKKYVKGE
jgi:large subunit ribosomal protein L24e